MGVSSTHFEYSKNAARWQVVRDVVDSTASKHIKPIEESNENRTARYRDDAILTNFTARTKAGLVGAAFRKPAELVIPNALDYIIDDATPEQWTLEQLSKACVGDVLEVGRGGLLVDYPAREGTTSAAEADALNIHARICKYSASSIINWVPERVNGRLMLIMVTLKESNNVLAEDGFTWITQVMYRVLLLTEEGYVQHIYNEAEELVDMNQPLRGDGSVWREIPFVFIGAENNDTEIDNAPLYDLAVLNIGHYRNSADIEEMARLIGQPTLVIASELSQEQFEQDLKGQAIKMGARQALFLGIGGSATYVQPTESQIGDLLMRRKEEQAVMLGARLITPSGGVETAEAARIRHGSENSVLITIVDNVSEGITSALEFASVFENVPDSDIEYHINKEFFADKLDPAAISAAIQLFDRGIMSEESLFNVSKKAGLQSDDKDFEDEQEELLGESPLTAIQQAPPEQPEDDEDEEEEEDEQQ